MTRSVEQRDADAARVSRQRRPRSLRGGKPRLLSEGLVRRGCGHGRGNGKAIQAGPKRYLIVHGDTINDRDLPYRFWRRVSKNPVMEFGVRFVPAASPNDSSTASKSASPARTSSTKSRLPLELMAEYGRKRAREGFTHVVLGHFHEKLVLPVDDSITVTIPPPWYESGEAMAIDPETGEFGFAGI